MTDDEIPNIKVYILILVIAVGCLTVAMAHTVSERRKLNARVNELSATVVDLSKLVIQQQELINRTGNNVDSIIGVLELSKTVDESQNRSIEALATR